MYQISQVVLSCPDHAFDLRILLNTSGSMDESTTIVTIATLPIFKINNKRIIIGTNIIASL